DCQPPGVRGVVQIRATDLLQQRPAHCRLRGALGRPADYPRRRRGPGGPGRRANHQTRRAEGPRPHRTGRTCPGCELPAMILEGIVTTVSAEGTVNVAPMGPRVDADFRRLVLRPFRTAQTYHNLKAHGEGVLHVTDDVNLLARAALGALEP